MELLASVLEAFARMSLMEVEEPVPDGNAVQVRARSCGICATDYR